MASTTKEIRYEGYGINGAAIIVDCLTDNRQRTVSEVRHAFSKYGGNLGTDGSVAFLFKHCGTLLFAPGTDEQAHGNRAGIGSGRRGHQRRRFDRGGHRPVRLCHGQGNAGQSRLQIRHRRGNHEAQNEVVFTGDDAVRMQKLLDAFDAIDDVQDVYTSAVIED